MFTITKGQYHAKFASVGSEVRLALDLRSRCFRDGVTLDQDKFDDQCQHVLISRHLDGQLVGCFRVMNFSASKDISQSYSAQFYDLATLYKYPLPLLEMGRFCIPEDVRDPDILRLAWAFLTRLVAENRVGLVFGCTSFVGTDPEKYRDAFALLSKKYIGPPDWRPKVKSKEVFHYGDDGFWRGASAQNGLKYVPPVLRSYLAMGGWVSDHAVVDQDLGTVHVFTALEINKMPKSRAELLKSVVN